MREGMGGQFRDNYLLYNANYGIYYILIGNFLLPRAESPSGRHRRKLFQKQSVMENPGSASLRGSTGVGAVCGRWESHRGKP